MNMELVGCFPSDVGDHPIGMWLTKQFTVYVLPKTYLVPTTLSRTRDC
jgi:hypothetical protein